VQAIYYDGFPLFVDRDGELDAIAQWWREPHDEPLLMSGSAGIGKTSLALRFAQLHAGVDPQRVRHVSLSRPDPPDPETVARALGDEDGRGLLIVDDADARGREIAGPYLEAIRAVRLPLRVMVVSRVPLDLQGWRLGVSTLSVAHREHLIRHRNPTLSDEEVARLAILSEGVPLAANMLADASRWDSVPFVVERFRMSGLEGLGNAGHPQLFDDVYRRDADERVDIRVAAVNDALIARLAAEPSLMYELRPRQLEEVVADLYEKQGFEVELTQETRDEGVDLYVVRRTPFGRLLTVVDTKRHRVDRPVGVGIVRTLYGVVEAKRASAGVVATTSFFTADARRFQEELPFRLGLQDYRDLTRMLQSATEVPPPDP
jgi:restriction system protein